jgi:hypothetical protein
MAQLPHTIGVDKPVLPSSSEKTATSDLPPTAVDRKMTMFLTTTSDCLTAEDLPPSVWTNARNLASYGTPPQDGVCGKSGNNAYPSCWVKETCRGAAGKGTFRMANGTLVKSGKSTVTKAGTLAYWQQCDNVGD